MAGYSGTPLPRKLGIKGQFRVRLIGLPADVEKDLKSALEGCRITKSGPLDFAMVFVQSLAELKKRFTPLAAQLAPAGMLWVSWPKRASGIVTDLNENDVRRIGLAAGLVDVKICAVNDVWSGLKFVVRLKDRPLT